MNGEQKTDKGRSILNFVIYLLFITCYLLFGCNNPVEPEKDVVTAKPGYGTVSIRFPDWEGRTIFPSMNFTHYVYTFTRTGGQAQEMIPVDGVFTLEAGNWNVKVKAYVGELADTVQDNLAATGEADFTIEPGPTKEVTIYFAENENSGEPGTFVYTIQYPPGTTVERFTMTRLPDMTEVTLGYTTLSVGNGITQTMETIPHGFYLLNIRLANNYVRYAGVAGISEMVHIYPLQTTTYGKTFGGDDFSLISVIYKLNDSGTTADLQEYYLYGETATNLNPERNGYGFLGWYTEPEFINEWNIGTPLTESITLYAKWELLVIQFWVSKDGGADTPFNNFIEALDSITAAGVYIVKIGENQAEIGVGQGLAPYTFTGNAERNITLTPANNPAITVKLTGSESLFTVNSGITLTLGEGVTLEGINNNNASLIQVNAGGKLIMKVGSAITGNGVVEAFGRGVNVASGGTFTMEGGKIFANKATTSSSSNGRGGGVYVSGTFTMSGGEISGNTSSSSGNASYYTYGGGVYVDTGGTFIMEDGKISDNTSAFYDSYSSGVYVNTGGTFTMEDGEISENTSYSYGSGVMSSGTFIMKKGKISGNSNGVYMSGGTFTMEDGEISGNGNGVYVSSGTFIMKSGKISGNFGSGVYTYGIFTMQGGEISGNTGSYGGGVYMGGGTFTLQGGKISGNTGSYGGGVYVGGGTFHMENGEISENISAGGNEEISSNDGFYAGGVYVNGGTFTMRGGEILENTGSGVYVYGAITGTYVPGTFTMEGGKILENTDGGVRVDAGAFTMKGGEISKNTTGNYGGGVYVYNKGSFTITGGEIFENKASYSGGGVRVRDGTLTMSGGEIFENDAHYTGGGVDLGETSESTMSGGKIRGNKADNGGGVYIGLTCTFTISDGEISRNTSRGVYVAGTFTKTGGTIFGYGNDTVNGNVVKDDTGTIQNSQGHAVYAVSRGPVIVTRRKEITSGPGDDLYFIPGENRFDGDWEY